MTKIGQQFFLKNNKGKTLLLCLTLEEENVLHIADDFMKIVLFSVTLDSLKRKKKLNYSDEKRKRCVN